jgi:hypothetical protein
LAIAAVKKSERRAKRQVQNLVAQTAREKWRKKKTTVMMIKVEAALVIQVPIHVVFLGCAF